jgi:hypothetical protein
MYGNDDSLTNDLISGFTTALAGYAFASWQKKKPGTLMPTLVGVPAGVLAFAARKSMRNPMVESVMEGLGYFGATWLGQYLAANTTTIGKVAPGAIPMQRITTTTTAYARSAPRAAAFISPAPAASYGGYELGYDA